MQLANDFDKKMNFPNSIDSLDGKHIEIQAPKNSEWSFYILESTHIFSIVLMALCDANYIFYNA